MAPVDDLEKALADGGSIEVQKRSGDWSTFKVFSLGKPFDVDGTMMCYGYGPDGEGEGSSSSGGSGQSKRSTPPAQAPPSQPSPASLAGAPQPDPSEPLPDFQGGPDDEWSGF